MSIIFIVLPIALVIVLAALAAFAWAARSGQFDDLDTPALRVLVENEEEPGPANQASAATPTQPEEGDGNAHSTPGV